MSDTSTQTRTLQIAVIGDVHDQWDEEDKAALQALGVDLVLFVGDFGNEAVGVVRSIAELSLPKAAIFGNHDAWYSATSWGRKKCPYNREIEDRVQLQIDLLGEAHVGYGKLDFPELRLTVVGGRPFSWGGHKWKHKSFYRDRYGIYNFEDSTARIKQAVDEATFNTVIFIGHCGPAGLGALPESPCGRDWKPTGGDFGDPDLAAAIAYAREMGKTVPLVTFGHMHHSLRHRKDIQRQRLSIDAAETVYLNAACVPRIVQTEMTCQRNFSLVTLNQAGVQQASLVWVNQHHIITASEDLLSGVPQTKSLQPLA
ncbi:TIGR04168 family protein [Oscillatoria sp. CS-180]|uniref:TIGR04168 family protein n=1 Tax=Oscillatoria sp. CS-180 TaxID=3021720 RepID=UPI00232FA6D8|nr:TIGR04168 family protein [Oscillatoria sp. CS-180]MDB9526083.1 TIGR04168 family protein [Oscillatoria sp. CS-180]